MSYRWSSRKKPDCRNRKKEDDETSGPAQRHIDTKLQTALTSDGLQRRLLSLFRDAQLFMEEQGVNILYLAVGRLMWFEAERADTARYAPLLLVPVQLERRSARDRFKLTWREEETQENLSLVAKLKSEFGIDLPKFPSEDELVPSSYFSAVADAVAAQPRWEVQFDEMTLGFFSFAKFLLYRDLDPRTWPNPQQLLSPIIGGLLRDGFPSSDAPFSEHTNLDEVISAARLDHVVDADSSQTVAIENVRSGRSLVVQGPPGTGKSQSITNLIATAVLDGKKVLFVAEKLAALTVVKRRLEATGLGALCLELHSHKAHKRAVVDEIGRTWQLGRPRGQELESIVPRLEQARSRLNAHALGLHTPLGVTGQTPFRVFGALANLEDRGRELGELELPDAPNWDAESVRERRAIIAELVQRIDQMGRPMAHPWRGAERETVLNIDLPKIREKLERLAAALPVLRGEAKHLAEQLRQPDPQTFAYVEALRRMAAHVAAAPSLDPEGLRDGVWNAGLEGLRDLVEHGRAFKALQEKLAGRVTDAALETDLAASRTAIAAHRKFAPPITQWGFSPRDYRLRGVTNGVVPKLHADRLCF